jgi:hypothetical protein
MKTYKVIGTQDTMFLGGAMDASSMQNWLNQESAAGWELVTSVSITANAIIGQDHQVFFVFAAEVSAPAPPPNP